MSSTPLEQTRLIYLDEEATLKPEVEDQWFGVVEFYRSPARYLRRVTDGTSTPDPDLILIGPNSLTHPAIPDLVAKFTPQSSKRAVPIVGIGTPNPKAETELFDMYIDPQLIQDADQPGWNTWHELRIGYRTSVSPAGIAKLYSDFETGTSEEKMHARFKLHDLANAGHFQADQLTLTTPGLMPARPNIYKNRILLLGFESDAEAHFVNKFSQQGHIVHTPQVDIELMGEDEGTPINADIIFADLSGSNYLEVAEAAHQIRYRNQLGQRDGLTHIGLVTVAYDAPIDPRLAALSDLHLNVSSDDSDIESRRKLLALNTSIKYARSISPGALNGTQQEGQTKDERIKSNQTTVDHIMAKGRRGESLAGEPVEVIDQYEADIYFRAHAAHRIEELASIGVTRAQEYLDAGVVPDYDPHDLRCRLFDENMSADLPTPPGINRLGVRPAKTTRQDPQIINFTDWKKSREMLR